MNVLVTGASRGVGFETCLAFARRGVENIIGVSRNRTGLDLLHSRIVEEFPEVHFYPVVMDLTDEEAYIGLTSFVEEHLGGELNILINNAGALVNKAFEELTMDEVRRVYEVNVFSVFRMISNLIHYIRDGHVVNISSIGGVQGSVKFPGLSAYSSSKGAISILTECLAEEYRDSGHRFNCLAFGAVQTEMLEEAFPGYQAPVTAEEMGQFVVQFAMDHGKLFNGKVLSVSSSTP